MHKFITIVAIGASIVSCSSAYAEVSDDLKFCGGLASGAERLACYDAAARIASRPVVRASPRLVARPPLEAQAAISAKSPIISAPAALNPFDGYYAAIGGGYGIATGRDFARSSNGIKDAFFNPTSTTQGPNVTVVAGRNIAVGWGVVGAEISGRWSDERFKDSQQTRSFCCSFFIPGVGSYSYRSDAGIHAAIRAGAAFDDFLVFAKVGVGSTHVSETFAVDDSGIRVASWLPSVLFGLGIEKNWGAFFARLSADFEAFNHKSTDVSSGAISGSSGADHITWTSRGTAMVGIRF